MKNSMNGKLRKAQREDPDIREIFELVKSGQADGYTIRGDVLFRSVEGNILFVVPKSMRT